MTVYLSVLPSVQCDFPEGKKKKKKMEAQKKSRAEYLASATFHSFFRAYSRAEDSETSLGIVNSETVKRCFKQFKSFS